MKIKSYLLALLLAPLCAIAQVKVNQLPPGSIVGTATTICDTGTNTNGCTFNQLATWLATNLPSIPLLAFSASGCSNSATLGGIRSLDLTGAGSFTAGLSGTCTVALTFALSAPNFWACEATDITAQIPFLQTARTVNGCTVSGVAASGDIISIRMTGY